jgi:hypothetical protein
VSIRKKTMACSSWWILKRFFASFLGNRNL